MESLKTNRRLPPTILALLNFRLRRKPRQKLALKHRKFLNGASAYFTRFLIFAVCAIFCAGTATAFAADTPEVAATPTVTATETLIVDDVWLTGDTLHIKVTDSTNGDNQTLELNLSDYAKPGDEFVTIQATDSTGRTSNAIQFKNPYYEPTTESEVGETSDSSGANANPANPTDVTAEHNGAPSESSVSSGDGAKPFTPDGAGSTIDNATSGDGKEFFTVETPDGNTFYLIVDRQRNSENVYLLNAVTEDDLSSLAKPGDGKPGSTTSAIETTATPTPIETLKPSATPEAPPAPAKSGGNTGLFGIIIVVLVVVGGAGYYFKIVRPKKAGDDYENEDDYADSEPDDEYPEKREEESDVYDTSEDEAAVEEREESEVSGE
jgi:hypothetical protein